MSHSVSVGDREKTLNNEHNSTSVGPFCEDPGEGSTSLGAESGATHKNSLALGLKARTTADNQLVLTAGTHVLRSQLEINQGTNTLGVNIDGVNCNIPLEPNGGGGSFNRVTANHTVDLATSNGSVNEIDFSTHNVSIGIDATAYALDADNTYHLGSRWYIGNLGGDSNVGVTITCSSGAKIWGEILQNGASATFSGASTVTYHGAFGMQPGDWFELHPLNGKILISGATAGSAF